MSSDRVLDYLTEELVVGKNIVTYRSLGIALGIHVNQAKNELALYHSDHAGSLDASCATYLISGEPHVPYLSNVRDTEMVMNDEVMGESSEDISETKITLVSDADLERSKEQYARIHYIHIYSLSPSPIREPALLCEPAKSLREAGKGIVAGSTVALGRITGPHVKKRTELQQARSSANIRPSAALPPFKNKPPGLSKTASLSKDTNPTIKSEPKDVKVEAPKPRPSGKLDFSKAKPEALKPVTETLKTEPAEPSSVPIAVPKPEPKSSKSKDKKPTLKLSGSDSEGDAVAPPQKWPSKRVESQSTARVMNGVIISEDENEEALKPARAKAAYKAKAKATSTDPQAEEDLRAMMDIDDDQVTKVSRAASTSEPGTSPPATDMEVEDREPEPETAPVPTTRKPPRKPKKVIPVGRNGLKKRRVVRSRMTTDEKGYLVTEDYSSYESVDEEAPPEKPLKGKGKKTSAPATTKDEGEVEKVAKAPAKSTPALKRKPSKPSGPKGGIASYFSKK